MFVPRMTNKGLQMTLDLEKIPPTTGIKNLDSAHTFQARLNCTQTIDGKDRDQMVVLFQDKHSMYYCRLGLAHYSSNREIVKPSFELEMKSQTTVWIPQWSVSASFPKLWGQSIGHEWMRVHGIIWRRPHS